MERGIASIDFINVDSMVQIHGDSSLFRFLCKKRNLRRSIDYEGVGLGSRDANSKAAASQASKIFQDYYPELLVRVLSSSYMYQPSTLAVQEVLHQRSDIHDLDILVVQTTDLCQHVGQDERCWQWYRCDQRGSVPGHRCQGTPETIWRRG
jgi:hypothetical protein